MVVPYERQRRVTEVVERGTLAEELRVHRDTEAVAVGLSRLAFERRDDEIVCRAWQDRTPHDDDVIGRLVAKRRADLAADSLQIPEVEAAVLPARRPDAQERRVGRAHGFYRIGRRPKTSFGHAAGKERLEPRLDDRTLSRVDRRDLVGADVHADDL